MENANIEILGIYKVPISETLITEIMELSYKTPISEKVESIIRNQCKELLENTVLIEVIVHNSDNTFEITDFTQRNKKIPKENWQVAWAETYLDEFGENLVVERWSNPPNTQKLRIAFFIHEWNDEIPLSSSYGDFTCPKPEVMPDRLINLVPYEPV